jgi:hypothetical protein
MLRGIAYSLIALLGLLGLGTVTLFGWLATLIATPLNPRPLDWWEMALAMGVVVAMIGGGLALVWLSAHMLLRTWRERHNNRYTADTWGLRRGEGSGAISVAWPDVRAFYRIEHRNVPGATPVDDAFRQYTTLFENPIFQKLFAATDRVPATTYVLDAGEHVLTWTLRSGETPANAEAYERLWRLIAAHTRLPLRDLTEQALVVLRAADAVKTNKPIPALPGQSQTDAALAELQGFSRGSPSTGGKRWERTLILGPLIAILILYGGGWGLEQIQHGGVWGPLYAALPDRIHAETPLFSDSLTADDGLWPVHPATADDAAYGYANGEYEISDGWGHAMLNRTYSDVAVEVTARLDSTGPPSGRIDDLGQVGLVLRASSNPDSLVTFTIGEIGDWSLMRYRDWATDAGQGQVLAHGPRPGLHTGFEHNRLLVLRRGSEYICYVNDQLVAAVHDDAFTSGQVGLWLQQKTVDDKTTVGYYSNFAVYPAI